MVTSQKFQNAVGRGGNITRQPNSHATNVDGMKTIYIFAIIDGFNDVWKIKNLDLFPDAVISVFNRYGKLLKQLNANSSGWNGTFNNSELPADDYWFHLNFGDGKIIKGHFSLKR